MEDKSKFSYLRRKNRLFHYVMKSIMEDTKESESHILMWLYIFNDDNTPERDRYFDVAGILFQDEAGYLRLEVLPFPLLTKKEKEFFQTYWDGRILPKDNIPAVSQSMIEDWEQFN